MLRTVAVTNGKTATAKTFAAVPDGGGRAHQGSRTARGGALALSAALWLLGSVPGVSSAETRWYVVGEFHLAMYSDGKFGPGTNCPQGGNGATWQEEAVKILEWRYHYSAARAKELLT